MEQYTVNQLAKLASVSVRTLHHYDQIGLLKPGERKRSGYRYYGESELYRLQQILFYRELDFPLEEIRLLLDDPRFNRETALLFHREKLQQRQRRLQVLLHTLDETLHQLKKEEKMSNYDMLYKGFRKEKVQALESEVAEKYGAATLDETKTRLNSLDKATVLALQKEGDEINLALSKLMHLQADDPRVQEWVKKHHQYTTSFYPADLTVYRAWAQLYVEDERFKATYDKVKPGLAAFLSKAMLVYCLRV